MAKTPTRRTATIIDLETIFFYNWIYWINLTN